MCSSLSTRSAVGIVVSRVARVESVVVGASGVVARVAGHSRGCAMLRVLLGGRVERAEAGRGTAAIAGIARE